MDQESWWGDDQFCPADQHATPRNEQILKSWEVNKESHLSQILMMMMLEREAVEDDEA